MYAEKFGKDERVECTSSSFFKQLRDRTPSKRWFLPNCFSAYFNKTCTNTQFLVNFVTLNILDKQMLVSLC